MQGIDLGNVVTSAAAGEHEIVISAQRLAAAAQQLEFEECECEMKFLLSSTPGAEEGKVMAINNLVIESCGSVLKAFQHKSETAVMALTLVHLLVAQNPIGRDRFCECRGQSMVKTVIEILLSQPGDTTVQEMGFRLVKAAATKKEVTKAQFIQHGGLAAITSAFSVHTDNAAIVRQVASTIHNLTNADDYSITLSKVFDTSKELVQGGVLPKLYDAFRKHGNDPDTVQDLLAAMKGCAVQNDIVKSIVNDGGLQLALDALRSHMQHPGCVGRCMLLLSNMAENDDVKKDLCQSDAMPLMLTAMQSHARDPRVLRTGCAALASLALRMPDNCTLLMDAGAGHVIVESMRSHPAHSELNRCAMIAARNLVVRNPEHRGAFLEEGVETLIVAARDTHVRCADAAFDCLRDLGCEYGGLGDAAGKGQHSAYVDCEASLLKRSQVSGGSAMVTWEEED